MRLVVTTEQRFLRTPDGAVWAPLSSTSVWTRYLLAFDRVRVVARVLDVDERPDGADRVDGDRVDVLGVPHYLGPKQYLARRRSIKGVLRDAVEEGDAVLLRVPSPLGALLVAVLRRQHRPYGLEVVGDPYDVFSRGSVQHPLRPAFRTWFTRQLRAQVRGATAVAYVTDRRLQERYPAGAGAVTASYSTIELTPEAFVAAPRTAPREGVTHLVVVAGMEQRYKGVDVLIDAAAELSHAGLPLHVTVVGDGRYRKELEVRAAGRGIAGRVAFVGEVPAGRRVREYLDRADLFVLPSRTEGLPRALIEAMARGLPALASDVGGVAELLVRDDLVPPGDALALASAIRSVVPDHRRRDAMSARNLARARGYGADVLAPRRTAFYRRLRERTELWAGLSPRPEPSDVA